jgi:bifunctional DNA-binding transcriptional regulator/antitoxin component of YhaV-PrlF toxin-antitoxin module
MRTTTTRIVGKFQVTVPPEVRDLYGLEVGDLLEWTVDETSGEIHLVAKRAQLITPRIEELARKSRETRPAAEGRGMRTGAAS